MTPPPDPAPPPAGGARRTERLLVVGIGLAVAALAWFRLTPVARATVWAEDGMVFLSHASAMSLRETVVAPYMGYLHVVPRIVAEAVVTVVPTSGWGSALTAASCAVTGAVAAGVLRLARDVVPSLPARTALALATVAAPLLPIEVLGNLANLHWLLLWLTPWLLLADGGGRVRRWLLAVVTFLVVTTEVQAAIFLPLLLWRPRARGAIPRAVAFVAGLALQLAAVLTTPRQTGGGAAPGVGEVLVSWSHVVVLPWFLGTGRYLAGASGDLGTVLALAVCAGLGAAVVVVARYGTRLQAVVAGVAPLVGVALWATALLLNTPATRGTDDTFIALRYGYVPSLLLVPPLALAVAVLPAVRTRRLLATTLAVQTVAVLALSLVPPSARGHGPPWDEGSQVASRACGATPSPPAVDVPIAPTGWSARIACAAVD